MKKRVTRKFYKKRVAFYMVTTLVLITTIILANIYGEYLKIKSTSSEFTERMTRIFIDNENIAISISGKYYELLGGDCALPKETKGVSIPTGINNPGYNYTCMTQALEFINYKINNKKGLVAGERYFYSPKINLLYFFYGDIPGNFSTRELDLRTTSGIYKSTLPDYYDRLLSGDVKSKGLSSTKIYFDKLTHQKTYTLISYVYTKSKNSAIGYVYYDHTLNELKENITKHTTSPPGPWVSAFITNTNDGESICIFGSCNKNGIVVQNEYSDQYALYLYLNTSLFLKQNKLELALLTFFFVMTFIAFIISTRIAARSYLKTMIDPLTNAYTRKSLKYINANADSCFIIFDLNKFKEINDLHGHHVGDEALKRVSHLINVNIRLSDRLIRLGGDEFLAHISNASYYSTIKMASRISTDIRSNPLAFEGKEIMLSVSFGVSSFEESVENSIKKADFEMYRQKNKFHNMDRSAK